MTGAAVWLLLRLRLLVLPLWILLAVVVTLQLPAFTNQSESDVGGMIATGSESVRVEERGVREFGTPEGPASLGRLVSPRMPWARSRSAPESTALPATAQE